MSTADYTTWSGLAKYLAQVCDVRLRRGQRYEWSYLLVLLAAEVIFARNGLHNTVTTTDALHTCKQQARQILAGGGDYVFVVKGNQRPLHDDIRVTFSVLPPHGSGEQAVHPG